MNKNHTNTKAVLLDLDGTLLDTVEDIADSINIVLSRENLPEHSIASYKQKIGAGLEPLVEAILPYHIQTEAYFNKFIQAVRDEYQQRWDQKSEPYDGIPELLEELSKLGIKKTILSNKSHASTRKIVDRFFDLQQFYAVMGAQEGIPLKPDPTSAITITNLLKTPAQEFFYLGDTSTDMETAAAAGMIPVGARWGFRSEEELKQGGAQLIVKHPLDLLDHLS